MLLRPVFTFIAPALPSARRPPSGLGWIHALSASEEKTLKLWEIY
jgi:hypothetical protein